MKEIIKHYEPPFVAGEVGWAYVVDSSGKAVLKCLSDNEQLAKEIAAALNKAAEVEGE